MREVNEPQPSQDQKDTIGEDENLQVPEGNNETVKEMSAILEEK